MTHRAGLAPAAAGVRGGDAEAGPDGLLQLRGAGRGRGEGGDVAAVGGADGPVPEVPHTLQLGTRLGQRQHAHLMLDIFFKIIKYFSCRVLIFLDAKHLYG